MSGLEKFLESLKNKQAEIEGQDIDEYVNAKLLELEPKIRAEAEAAKQYESKVIAIKIEAITDALAVVEAEVADAPEEAVALAETIGEEVVAEEPAI